MPKKLKKTEVPNKILDKKDAFCVCEIYEKGKKSIYFLRGSQARYTDKIILENFIGIPAGLYLNKGGYGFGNKGIFLLKLLKDHFAPTKKLELVITRTGSKGIKSGALIVSVKLSFDDVRKLLIRLGTINQANNNELSDEVSSFLSTKFPKKINTSSKDFDDYKAGEIYSLLSKKKVADKLNDEDLNALGDLYPKIFQANIRKHRVRAVRNSVLIKSKKITDKIFLDDVIKEFETNLAKKTLSEENWQKFLRDKVFKFLANYIDSIEKENISADTSLPDFVLADVYGFIDMFEIKTHDTQLMSFDSNHDNYYWKPEVAKAISQLENYIDKIVYNPDPYIKKIKRQKKIDIKVVRPRGYIIAGSSKQFKNDKEFEDYRKLSKSLRNIDFILYDQLLGNLKNLRSRI